jgi:Mn2+/Fe2+ NRAMP family transporter
MFIVEAALVLVTAGLAGNLTGWALNPVTWSSIVLIVIIFILLLGKYPVLDLLMKVIIVILAASTLFAVFSILISEQVKSTTIIAQDYYNVAGILFIVALMGWMPSIVDISVWHSLWSIERKNQTGYHPSLKEARFDFNLGYIGTTFLAFAFLSLGALVMSGSGESFSNSGVAFAGQLVALYTNILGGWAGPIISIAAFITMFSTTLTVTDAYPRVIKSASELIFPDVTRRKLGNHVYFTSMIILSLTAIGIIAFLMKGIKSLIDVATTMSFLTTPVLVYINYRVVISPQMPQETRPGSGMRIFSWAGIAFWIVFALIFLFVRFWHEV